MVLFQHLGPLLRVAALKLMVQIPSPHLALADLDDSLGGSLLWHPGEMSRLGSRRRMSRCLLRLTNSLPPCKVHQTLSAFEMLDYFHGLLNDNLGTTICLVGLDRGQSAFLHASLSCSGSIVMSSRWTCRLVLHLWVCT